MESDNDSDSTHLGIPSISSGSKSQQHTFDCSVQKPGMRMGEEKIS